MALASTSLFASFDVTDGSQDRDISPYLAEALILDFTFLGRGCTVDFGHHVHDTLHYWNADQLNSDQVTVSGSVTSTGTTVTVSTGHGARLNIGDLLYDGAANSTEVLQVTAISTDTVTVSRGYNSTAQSVIADAATLYRMPAEQEASDIGNDKSLAPLVYSNPTQIIRGNDIQISGTQLSRQMATTALADYFAHQLENRIIEWRRVFTRALLYGEKSSSNAGSDTVYRTFGGLRYWARDNSGVVDSASGAMSWSNLNTQNKTVIDKGEDGIDTLLVGTDLVSTIAGFDSTLRRLRESDSQVGYTVQEIQLAHGQLVEVIMDGRVKTGDYFMYKRADVTALPFGNPSRALVMKSPQDAVDGRKARTLGEWTCEVQQPTTKIYGRNKT